MSVLDQIQLDGARYDIQDTKAQAMLAPAESTSTASAAHLAGTYFIYNGALYQAIVDIASGGSIVTSGNSRNCEAITVVGEIDEIKRELNYALDGDAVIMIPGGKINTVNAPVDVSNVVPDSATMYAVVDCQHGDCFTITGTGGQNYRLWCFIDSTGGIIEATGNPAPANLTKTDFLIYAPANASKLVLNFIGQGYCVKKTRERFCFCGYLDDSGITSLASCVEPGWYGVKPSYVASIIDKPSDYDGAGFTLEVYRRTLTRSAIYIMQRITSTNGNVWVRFILENGTVFSDWVKTTILEANAMVYNGNLSASTIPSGTALSSKNNNGFYYIGATGISRLTDLPEDINSNNPLFLQVMKNSGEGFIQILIDTVTGKTWTRYNDGNWLKVIHYAPTATACIIGASIEAGTTHESASSGAHVDGSKAYLTVALRNNGVKVTNMSHGGMGFLRPASSDKYDGTNKYTFKYIVDNTDFTAFDSVYISLGSNDWAYDSYPLGDPSDTVTSNPTTVCEMLKYGLEMIYNANDANPTRGNPKIKVFLITPLNRKKSGKGDITTQWGWNGMNQATVPYCLKDLADAIKEICDTHFVELIGHPTKEVVNMFNLETVLPDGAHPNQATMAQMAKNMTGRISFK